MGDSGAKDGDQAGLLIPDVFCGMVLFFFFLVFQTNWFDFGFALN